MFGYDRMSPRERIKMPAFLPVSRNSPLCELSLSVRSLLSLSSLVSARSLWRLVARGAAVTEMLAALALLQGLFSAGLTALTPSR